MTRASSVLFCCDHNSVRSPMAEGITKSLIGQDIYIQSAGVKNDLDIDGFAVAVCEEIGVELAKHKVRSFADMEEWGDDLSSYDLVIALSPTSRDLALHHTKYDSVEVEFWDIADPTGHTDKRDEKMANYRAVRDDLLAKIRQRFC